MIAGIGTDLFGIARMAAEIRAHGRAFTDRIFTPSEIDSCERRRYPARHYAARFAAKEALLKALPPERVDGAVWREIEILNDRRGAPRIVLHGGMKELAARCGISGIFVSLSHTRDMASASVVVESKEGTPPGLEEDGTP